MNLNTDNTIRTLIKLIYNNVVPVSKLIYKKRLYSKIKGEKEYHLRNSLSDSYYILLKSAKEVAEY